MGENTQEQNYLTVKEFAEYARISETLARKLIRQPECEYSLKIGGKYLIIKEEFDKVAKYNARYHIAM